MFFTAGDAGGADEDDFHALNRRKAIVDKEERVEQKSMRHSRHTGGTVDLARKVIPRTLGNAPPKPKIKVVSF